MSLDVDIRKELKNGGADFVHFINISKLHSGQNREYPAAILFGIALTPEYLQVVTNTPDYVPEMIRSKKIESDEFHLTELKTDRLADYLADYIAQKGYSAFSQSEDNLDAAGLYNKQTQSTPLPHKTIAGMAGLGWIGKHNLLVTPDYGSAISMCSVLTNVPLKTSLHRPLKSLCGNCNVCIDVCKVNAIHGKSWDNNIHRNELVDVFSCTTCLKCLVMCPFTQVYIKKSISIKL